MLLPRFVHLLLLIYNFVPNHLLTVYVPSIGGAAGIKVIHSEGERLGLEQQEIEGVLYSFFVLLSRQSGLPKLQQICFVMMTAIVVRKLLAGQQTPLLDLQDLRLLVLPARQNSIARLYTPLVLWQILENTES